MTGFSWEQCGFGFCRRLFRRTSAEAKFVEEQHDGRESQRDQVVEHAEDEDGTEEALGSGEISIRLQEGERF